MQGWAQSSSHQHQDQVPPSRPASFISAHSDIADRPYDQMRDAQTAARTRAIMESSNPHPQRSTAAWEVPEMDPGRPNEEYEHSVFTSDRSQEAASSSSSEGFMMVAPSRRGRGRGRAGLQRGDASGQHQQQQQPQYQEPPIPLLPVLHDEYYSSHNQPVSMPQPGLTAPTGHYAANLGGEHSGAGASTPYAEEEYYSQEPMVPDPSYYLPGWQQGYVEEEQMSPVARERRSHNNHHRRHSSAGGQKRPSDAQRRSSSRARQERGCC